MTTDAGWELPARYGDPQAEAAAARQSAVVADVSHWGRIRIRGGGAAEVLVRLGAADAPRQEDDTVRQVELRDAAEGTIDRARLVRLEEMWLLLTSPAARPAVLARAQELAEGLDAKVDDQTQRTAMLACMGPKAAARLDVVLPITVSDAADGTARTGSILIAKYIALRSDIGGDSACNKSPQATSEQPATRQGELHALQSGGDSPLWRMEVILPGLLAGKAWRFITDKAGANRMPPIGTEAMAMLMV
jgi:glycine cleavage system aminomethyltransferase T